MASSMEKVNVYFARLPAHKFLHIKNYESHGYWDFWQRQSEIPGQDCETIFRLLDGIKGKLDDRGSNDLSSGSGQIMAYIQDPDSKSLCHGIPSAECYGVRLAHDYCDEVPSQMLLIDIPEADYLVFEHGPFNYEEENSRVAERIDAAIEAFSLVDTPYCYDTSPGRIAYLYHDPERFWKYMRPVRKR